MLRATIAITPARRKTQQGATAILFTMLCSLLLIPVAGLAIDVSIVFLMKAKLSAAVDATALATARGLSVGTTYADQQANATVTGTSYFAANLPAATMGAKVVGGGPSINIQSTTDNTLQANVQATIQVPLYFLRILGFNTSTLSDTGQASRRISNIVLVLDRSGSMANANACQPLVASVQGFVNQFVDGRDTLAMVTFQSTANQDYPTDGTPGSKTFKSASPTLSSTIARLQCDGGTTTSAALQLAYVALQKMPHQPIENNVILLFTDGRANGFVGTFTALRTQQQQVVQDTRYDWYAYPYLWNPPFTAPDCNSSLTGVLLSVGGNPDPVGYTAGIFQNTGEPLDWVSPYSSFPAAAVSAAADCNFKTASPTPIPSIINSWGYTVSAAYPYNTFAIRDDIGALPETDIYGNSLRGFRTSDVYPDGPYIGKLRIDTPLSVIDASLNAADAMANTIRNDTALKPTIYTIGLGGTPEQQIDTEFLERVANDSRSSSYRSSQKTGLYIYSDKAGLALAFQRIASQILRLSK